MEEEAIYCNGISFLYPPPPKKKLLCGEGCFSEVESRKDSFSLSAGFLSAWGEEEVDKRDRVGVETEEEKRFVCDLSEV